MANVRPEYLPLNLNVGNAYNLPSLPVLKSLDVNVNELSFSSLNNCLLQFTAAGLFFPITTIGSQPLTSIGLRISIQTIDNSLYDIQLPASAGYCNIRFCLQKKLK